MTTFVDTNVFVYAVDPTDPEKQGRARAWIDHLWRHGSGVTSMQVLNEYYVTVTRKLSSPMAYSDARADVGDLMSWDPVRQGAAITEAAFAIEERLGFSWWDSLVVASALTERAESLLTEDLQDGQVIDGLTVLSPFTSAPPPL